jgi:hypothetical protein
VIQVYKYKNGKIISDVDMAEHFAYFVNAKQTEGPINSKYEDRGSINLLMDIMSRGGCIVEYHFLEPVDLTGISDRKELAQKLEEIIRKNYTALRKKK